MARLIHPRQKLSYVQRELLLSSTQRPYIMRHAVPSLVKVSVLLSYSLRANEDKPALTVKNAEDNLLWAQNKWLLAHKDTAEAADGAHVGITGDNIDIADLIK